MQPRKSDTLSTTSVPASLGHPGIRGAFFPRPPSLSSPSPIYARLEGGGEGWIERDSRSGGWDVEGLVVRILGILGILGIRVLISSRERGG